MPVIPEEPYAVSPIYYNPLMLVGPTDFELDGYTGNISTWQEYGKFYYSLYKDRDILPPEQKQEVHELTDNVKDPRKKIAILYEYLQKNTHYVLIMFGIGGLQPYDAAYVARNKYGDCKALSNFMISLLKEAGIRGFPVLIWGGEEEREFIPDFPSHQANHVICAVPLQNDTVWLECTSHSLPSGYLSAFTSNRYGLLVNEQGGYLVRTPAYLLKDNTCVRKLSAILDIEGNLKINSETSYKALSYDAIQSRINSYSKEMQLDYLKKNLNLPTYTINSFNYTEDNSDRLPVIHETLDISVSEYSNITGRRIFINPNVLGRSVIKLPEENNRRLDFKLKKEFREIDSVEIIIPKGFTFETRVNDVLLETRYGRYQVRTLLNDDKILYFRYYDQYSGRFPASEYESIRNFFNRIYEADHTQIVLVKKTSQ